ncbi:MAG: adenylate/guanylate cyclase domain-containing protein [Armatimonadota bacterium]|nr:adenylate/guanylate cyclase domain-containing protein [Armatimonadota bacterium]MCX7777827.1 adenylate/guanylate cyclase domain-containing protein [Armatimonadota bacterium]MDW8025942.1 adenylate/guanylate cyclase domain-containing protein [Armatimonadota bacterium]
MLTGISDSAATSHHLPRVVAIAVALSVISWWLVEPLPIPYLAELRPPLSSVRWFMHDIMIRLHARIHTLAEDAPITIIAIDEPSLRKYGLPIKRECYAKLVRQLSAAGAKVIVIDVLFADETKDDVELADAIKEASQRSSIVLAANVFFGWHEIAKVHLPEHLVIPKENMIGMITAVPTVELPVPSLMLSGGLVGAASLFLDEDGVCRRLPLVIKGGGMVLPSLATAAACGYLGVSLNQLRGVGGNGLWLEKHFVRTQSAPKWFGWENDFVIGIDFVRRTENGTISKPSFKTYSLIQALSGGIPSKDISGHIVLVGAISPSLPDFRPTPLEPAMSGVEIFAHAIATILHQTPVRDASSILHFLLALFVGVVTCILLLRRRPLAGLLWAANVLAACFAIPQLVLLKWHIIFNPLCALISWVSVSILVAIVSAMHAERRAEHLVRMLSLYVAPEVAKQLAKVSGLEEQLRGQKRDVTILFSDIRGFTMLTHSLQPYETVSLLSRYFTVMSEIVFLYGGMVNNMMGDGLMAIFGVMPDKEDHAERAVLAAWHMVEALDELQFEWERVSGRRLTIGIGVNTGEAVVGDIRTPYKGHFTAIGDCVNLAQRLEQLTKEFNCQLLIGEETYERVGWMVIAERVDASVKGFEEPITAYKVIGLSEHGMRFRRSHLANE